MRLLVLIWAEPVKKTATSRIEVAVSILFAIFVTLASFDAQARRRRLTREGQSSFMISLTNQQ